MGLGDFKSGGVCIGDGHSIPCPDFSLTPSLQVVSKAFRNRCRHRTIVSSRIDQAKTKHVIPVERIDDFCQQKRTRKAVADV